MIFSTSEWFNRKNDQKGISLLFNRGIFDIVTGLKTPAAHSHVNHRTPTQYQDRNLLLKFRRIEMGGQN